MIKLGRERERIVEDYGPFANVLELAASELFDTRGLKAKFLQTAISDHTGKWRNPWPCNLFQEVNPLHQRPASRQEGLRNTQGTDASASKGSQVEYQQCLLPW